MRAKYDGAMADCIGRSIHADELEAQIWGQIVTWAEKPGPLLRELAAQFQRVTAKEDSARERARRIQADRDKLQAERDRIITLYRIGELTEADLRHQLRELTEAEGKLRADAERADKAVHEGEEARDAIDGARDVLQRLHAEIADGQMTPARQREYVEKLIREIRVHTTIEGTGGTGRPKYSAVTRVVYRFEHPDAGGGAGTVISTEGTRSPSPGRPQ
jgi:hypothetical protein